MIYSREWSPRIPTWSPCYADLPQVGTGLRGDLLVGEEDKGGEGAENGDRSPDVPMIVHGTK